MPSPGKSIARAAAAGVAIALLVASLGFAVLALRGMRAECAPMGTPQCAMELELAGDVARMQSLAAAGCGLVGMGLAMLLRNREERA